MASARVRGGVLVVWVLCGAAHACGRSASRPESSASSSPPHPAQHAHPAQLASAALGSVELESHLFEKSEQKLPPAALPESLVDRSAFILGAPSPALQEIACDPRGIVRLAATGFVSYRLQPLRARRHPEPERFLSVTALTGFSALLIGSKSTQRYYHGQEEAERFARIPLLGAGYVEGENDDIDRFWVRFLRDDAFHQFHLDADAFHAENVRVVVLKGSDQRIAARLRSGAFVFTRAQDLVWQFGSEQRTYPLSDVVPEPIEFASAERTDQVWAFDAKRGAVLLEMTRGRPLRQQLAFRGQPFSIDVEGARVAVVSVVQTQAGHGFVLQVFERGALVFEHGLPENGGASGSWQQRAMANRDVCLIPGRPWVVVGGRDGVEVFEHGAGTLLFSELRLE
jgi:hypothetical protein